MFGKGKMSLESFEYHDILLVKWNDISPVILCITFDTVLQLNKIKKIFRNSKKNVSIEQPNLIKNYTKFLSGVD